MSKAFDVQQEKEKTSSAFFQRFRDQTRKYSGLDPEDPIGQGILKVTFVTRIWPDIAKKLQKIECWNEKTKRGAAERSSESLCEKEGAEAKIKDKKT